MLKKYEKIMSITSLSLFTLFAVYAGHVYYKSALYTCSVIGLAEGVIDAEYQFNAKAIIYIVAAAILLLALITHVLKLIKSNKLVFPIISAAFSIVSLVLLFALNTILSRYMFFRYILHIPDYNFFRTIEFITVTVVFIFEVAALVISVLHSTIQTKKESEI